MAIMPAPKGYPDHEWNKSKQFPGGPSFSTASSASTNRPITIQTLFPNFDRWAIGFDPLLQTLKDISSESKLASYPPYNIYKTKETYILEIAAAGFSKEDLKISVREQSLTVEGSALPSADNYVHKGIASRDFKQDFALGEYVVVDGAEMKDGMLRITLRQELPEEKKSKIINIQ